MANTSIHDFVVMLLCGDILLFMIWNSCHNVFNRKNINTFGFLTFIQVRTDKKYVPTEKKKKKMDAYK